MTPMNGLAGEEEVSKLVKHHNKAYTAYSMEISAKKTKLMTNTTSSINKEMIWSKRAEAWDSAWAHLYLLRVLSLRYSPG